MRAMLNMFGSFGAPNESPVHIQNDCEAKEGEGVLEGSGETVMNLIKYLFFMLFILTSLTKMIHGGHQTNV